MKIGVKSEHCHHSLNVLQIDAVLTGPRRPPAEWCVVRRGARTRVALGRCLALVSLNRFKLPCLSKPFDTVLSLATVRRSSLATVRQAENPRAPSASTPPVRRGHDISCEKSCHSSSPCSRAESIKGQKMIVQNDTMAPS